MKDKTIMINLADLTDEKLIKILEDNNAGLIEMLAILASLYDMYGHALHFSAVLYGYAKEKYPDILEIFAREQAAQGNITPEGLTKAVELLHAGARPVIH